MSIIIFANKEDKVAKDVANCLLANRLDCEFISDYELCTAKSWTHQSNSDGVFTTVIGLSDGREIHSDTCSLVFNRLRFLQSPFFIDETNRQYAEMEWYALYVSFLKSVEKALLMPFRTIHINGNYEQFRPYYLQMAADTGLPVGDYIRSSKLLDETNLIPFHFAQETPNSFYRHLTALDYVERKPVIYLEKFSSKEKYIYIKGSQTVPFALYPYHEKLELLTQKLGFPMLELSIGIVNNGIKILDVNPFPNKLTSEQLEDLTQLFIQTKRSYDITTRNSIRKPHVVGG